jgi:hypothetical protein
MRKGFQLRPPSNILETTGTSRELKARNHVTRARQPRCAMTVPGLPHEWKTLYAAAMLEFDGKQLQLRIEQAESAMRQRLTQLERMPSIDSEEMEIRSALDYLRRLRTTVTAA